MSFKLKTAIILMAILSGVVNAAISDIQDRGDWYYLFDGNGKRYKTISKAASGDLVGFSESYFVCKKGDWYYFFDDKGTRFLTKSVTEIGEIKTVLNTSFTSLKNSWIYSWDKKGNRTGTRPAK